MVNLGVIGYGYWGPNLVRNFDALPDANVKTVCDKNEKALERLKRENPKINLVTEMDEIFNDDEIDAVVIALPAPNHAEFSIKALRSGKHVFVEKPLTISAKDAREVIKTADETGLTLMVGHLLLYHPSVICLKEIVRSGELGELYYINSQRLNLGKVRTNENALWSLAPHDISILLYLFEELPESVIATGSCFLQKGIEDMAFLHVKFRGNKIAHVHVSWLDPHRVRRTTIVGEKKMAVFDDVELTEKIKIFDKKIERPFYANYGEALTIRFGNIHIPHVDIKEPLRLEAQHFVDCLKNGEKPITDAHSGLDVVRVLEAADHSLKAGGKEVRLDELD